MGTFLEKMDLPRDIYIANCFWWGLTISKWPPIWILLEMIWILIFHFFLCEEEDPDLKAIDLVLSYILDEEILPELFTFFDRKSRGVIANADIYYLVYLIWFWSREVLCYLRYIGILVPHHFWEVLRGLPVYRKNNIKDLNFSQRFCKLPLCVRGYCSHDGSPTHKKKWKMFFMLAEQWCFCT